MKIKKITAKTSMSKILKINPSAVEILFDAGMRCFDCPMAQMETLEECCKAHGMNKKEIDALIKKIN
jgi:hybrid cluster-associated redox disulfide protein